MDHFSALWWLGLFYGRIEQLKEALTKMTWKRATYAAFVLFISALPYMVLIVIVGRLLFFGAFKLGPIEQVSIEYSEYLVLQANQMAQSILFSALLVLVAFGEVATGILIGIVFGVFLGTTIGIDSDIIFATAILNAIVLFAYLVDRQDSTDYIVGAFWAVILGSIYFVIPLMLGGIPVFLKLSLSNTTVSSLCLFSSLIFIFRAYHYPIHLFFIWPKFKPMWYPRHPVAWDNICTFPFPRLDPLLASYAEIEPEAGHREIDRLIDYYPSQRKTGLRALCRVIARKTAKETRLSRLDELVARLPEGDKGFLSKTRDVRLVVSEIAQLQRRLDTLDRPLLREPTANSLYEKIKIFQTQISGYPEPLNSEFRKAATHWVAIAEQQYHQVRDIFNREPAPQVFRAGDPVDCSQEAFILREAVLGELDRQLTLATGCPGLILYARRRMGKSTLLSNLKGFLPVSTRIAVVSMQNPDAFASQSDLLRTLLQTVAVAVPEAGLSVVKAPSLQDFFKRLAECNTQLEKDNCRLLLAIDEYENLDCKLGEGVFSEDLLANLRESIQYHRRIVWVFAGSHAIDELSHAPWPSYLISARTVEIPPFSPDETRRLLTEPLRYSRLWKDDDPKRPHFDPGFWGEGGIERIHAEAAGWPHLVQLLAETAVDLCNDRERATVDVDLLEQAISKALTAGDTVLRHLLRGEASEAEWAYINGFRRHDTQAPPENVEVYRGLRRRLLVEEAEGGAWRLRVPLLQRWLRARG